MLRQQSADGLDRGASLRPQGRTRWRRRGTLAWTLAGVALVVLAVTGYMGPARLQALLRLPQEAAQDLEASLHAQLQYRPANQQQSGGPWGRGTAQEPAGEATSETRAEQVQAIQAAFALRMAQAESNMFHYPAQPAGPWTDRLARAQAAAVQQPAAVHKPGWALPRGVAQQAQLQVTLSEVEKSGGERATGDGGDLSQSSEAGSSTAAETALQHEAASGHTAANILPAAADPRQPAGAALAIQQAAQLPADQRAAGAAGGLPDGRAAGVHAGGPAHAAAAAPAGLVVVAVVDAGEGGGVFDRPPVDEAEREGSAADAQRVRYAAERAQRSGAAQAQQGSAQEPGGAAMQPGTGSGGSGEGGASGSGTAALGASKTGGTEAAAQVDELSGAGSKTVGQLLDRRGDHHDSDWDGAAAQRQPRDPAQGQLGSGQLSDTGGNAAGPSGAAAVGRRQPDEGSRAELPAEEVVDAITKVLPVAAGTSAEADQHAASDPAPLRGDSDAVGGAAAGGSACSRLLRSPKVALLFLTRGELFHEPTWDLWFRYAAGLLPAPYVQAAGCSASALAEMATGCAASDEGVNSIVAQHLFSVYIHTAPEFPGFNVTSSFHGREVPRHRRIKVEWGRHSLVEASRELLRQALRDPANAKFALLSEAAIPLYPPHTTWAQLTGERRSRINACDTGDTDLRRWSPHFETRLLKERNWRKSSQWFALTREHAKAVVAERHIDQEFAAHCFEHFDELTGRERDCYSDEHYIPTLLSALGRENETDCTGFLVHVDWTRGGPHPRTYTARDLSPARLRLLRMPTSSCAYPAAIRSSLLQFVSAASLSAASCTAPVPPYEELDYQCPLFARKFPKETAGTIHALMRNCRNRLRIVKEVECDE